MKKVVTSLLALSMVAGLSTVSFAQVQAPAPATKEVAPVAAPAAKEATPAPAKKVVKRHSRKIEKRRTAAPVKK